MVYNYKNFLILENIQQAKLILSKKGIDPKTDKNYNDIIKPLKNLPNLIGKFVHFHYIDNVPMDNIKNVINWILNNRQSIPQLPNNILNYNDFEKLEDDIQKLNREQTIKRFYNSLYRSMKDQIDKLEDKSKFNDLAYNFMKLPKELKDNFTPLKYFEANNISIDDFMNALNSYIENNTVNSDKGSILNKIKEFKNNLKIVYDKNNVLVIQSNDKQVIKEIGSKSWCIVYSNDYYQERYFGYGRGNTQYIIFNFNLPSSSANSMFGITIDENGKTIYGACQDKYNNGKHLQEILDITEIPENIIKPDKDILKEKEKYNEFIRTLKEDSLVDILNYIKNNNIKNIDKDTINNHLNNYRRISQIEEDLKRLLINNKDNLNDFLNKYNIFSILTDRTIIKTIYVKTSEDVFGNIDNIIIILLHHIKNRNKREYANAFDLNFIHNTYFFNLIKNIKLSDIKKVNDKFNILDDNEKVQTIYDLINDYRKDYIRKFLNLELFRDKYSIDWETYLEFYNEYGLKLTDDINEYKYYNLLNIFANDKMFYFFIDDDNFTIFMIDLMKKHPYDIDIRNIITQNNTVGYYDLFSHDNIARIYEEFELMPNNTIESIFLFNKTNLVSYEQLGKEMGLKMWENEGYYIEISDFTELDEYFEYEYFNNMYDNWHNYASDINDGDATESILLVNNENLKQICDLLNKDDLLNDDINKKILMINELDKEDIKKLKRDIINIIDDGDFTQYNLINALKNSMSRAYNTSYEDELHNKLMSEIMSELPFEYFKDGKSYKFKDNKICLIIDLNSLLDISDYNDLYYNYDDNFKWGELMDYYIKDKGKLKPYLDYVYGDWEDCPEDFNDELNERLSEI